MEDRIITIVIMGVILFILFAWWMTNEINKEPCDFFKNSDVRYLPARCLNYFNNPIK